MWVSVAGKRLLLSYSTNVHPGVTLTEIQNMLVTDVGRVRELLGVSGEFGLELHLGTSAASELVEEKSRRSFCSFLDSKGLFLFSLNAFPLGDFHQSVVKDNAYRPDWTTSERQTATIALARFLSELLPEGVTGSLSTVPGSFKPWGDTPETHRQIACGFAPVLFELSRIELETGRRIVLAVEPEPFCTFSTIDEFVQFVQNVVYPVTSGELREKFKLSQAEAETVISTYLGVNLDACHLAAQFEEPGAAVGMLAEAGIPVAKFHVSSAARVLDPGRNGEGLELLATLAEPKYLHQTFAVNHDGEVVFTCCDLPEFLSLPAERIAEFAEVRTHFHMPLFGSSDGALANTSDITRTLLAQVIALEEEPHIVNETYTWPVMPGVEQTDVHQGIARELKWTLEQIREV